MFSIFSLYAFSAFTCSHCIWNWMRKYFQSKESHIWHQIVALWVPPFTLCVHVISEGVTYGSNNKAGHQAHLTSQRWKRTNHAHPSTNPKYSISVYKTKCHCVSTTSMWLHRYRGSVWAYRSLFYWQPAREQGKPYEGIRPSGLGESGLWY